MKKFFVKVKDWFVAHKPTKRKLIQVYAALLFNAHLKGFATGKIYTGITKKMCLPGLNCYSCPGAVTACPLGALQDSLAQSGTRAPAYIFGILILFGLLLGRLICGFLCPFGLIQELLYKIRTPKLRKSRFTRVLSYFKYVLLVIVIAIPVIYAGIPSFCKYICPAGTAEGAVSLLANIKNSDFYGMLGYLFSWKFCVLVAVAVASIFIYRFFCRFICPLGAIYSLFCKISLLGVKLDKDKCIDCGLCIQGCKMDIKHVGDHECIQCGECISVCPVQAISWKGSKIFLRNTSPLSQPAAVEGEKIALLEIAKNNSVQAVGAEEVALADDRATEAVAQPEVVEEQEVAAQPDGVSDLPKPRGKGGEKVRAFFTNVKNCFKKPRFVVEFVAWVLATALLISALVVYNLPEKQHDTVSAMTLTTYASAASEGGKEYSTDGGNKVKVFYFWRTDDADSVAGVAALNEFKSRKSADLDVEKEVDVVVIHSIYKDDRNVAQFIEEQGWNAYDLIFAQDNMETNAYAKFGGDISVPKPITAVMSDNRIIYSYGAGKGEGTLTADELYEKVKTAKRKTVYGVGDMCPLFTLDAYNAGEGATFSVEESRGKVTVINFWFTDCDPCKAELPEFEKVYEEYGGTINMAVIHSTDIPRGGVRNFLDNNADKNGRKWASYLLTFAQDTKEKGAYEMLGGRGAYPTTIVLNKDGKITFARHGSCSEELLRQAIENAAE